MDWIEVLRQAIGYMEEHLREDITAEDVAQSVNISGLYFMRGFKIVTGCSPAEYIRNRKLYLAALDIQRNEDKVIDIAYEYGYETPESFSKAFRRFHGISPSQVKSQSHRIQTSSPEH